MRILITLIVLLWFENASATPLTNGLLNISEATDFGPFVNASGPDLRVSVNPMDGTVLKDDARSGFATGFSPGAVVTLSSTASLFGGEVTLGNESHSVVPQASNTLKFTTESFTLPSVAQNTSVSVPFTMTGTLHLDNGNDLPLTGAGVANGGLITGGTTAMFFSFVRYDFMAIPEPSSVLLVGSGIAGLLWRYRKI